MATAAANETEFRSVPQLFAVGVTKMRLRSWPPGAYLHLRDLPDRHGRVRLNPYARIYHGDLRPVTNVIPFPMLPLWEPYEEAHNA